MATVLDLNASLSEVAQSGGGDAASAVTAFTHRAIDDLCGRPVNFSKAYTTVKRAQEVASAVQACVRSKFAQSLTQVRTGVDLFGAVVCAVGCCEDVAATRPVALAHIDCMATFAQFVHFSASGVLTHWHGTIPQEQLVASMTEQHGLPAKLAKLIAGAVFEREAEIKRQLVEHLVAISSSHMTDFDWSLRLTMATSHLSQVREPMLILTVYTVLLDGSNHEYTFEMTRDDLDRVLGLFAKIASEIQDATDY